MWPPQKKAKIRKKTNEDKKKKPTKIRKKNGHFFLTVKVKVTAKVSIFFNLKFYNIYIFCSHTESQSALKLPRA